MHNADLNATMFFRQESANLTGDERMTIFDGQAAPVEIKLAVYKKTVLTFGRGEGCDIVLQSKFVSRLHGYFRYENGAWMVENHPQSTNGLTFDGTRIEHRVLQNGDNIRIDNTADPNAAGVLMVFSVGGEAIWQTFTQMSAAEITIGRGEGCDIRLDHVSVSKLHAKIINRGGIYSLVDNNSTNGIIVNGKKVTAAVQLREKDMLIITNSIVIFSAAGISYQCYKSGISVEAHSIIKRVAKDKVICDNVSIRIEPGELMTIVGGSGAGKSTLMNCLSGYSRPSEGPVLVNNLNLYENFDALKNVIGYVPQSDIVYDNLSVFDMLFYAAQLRLPADMSEAERTRAINTTIEKVELIPNKDTLIKNLSGGQRKRASIAVELLSDPNLFFLDEPASGLDPGTERNLMITLKKMAADGKTVIFVTHSTLNLHLCDKIAFMGYGGKLCFYGSYNEALRFFNVDDIVDVYNLIYTAAPEWEAKYNAVCTQKTVPATTNATVNHTSDKGALTGAGILTKRNLHILRNDRTRLILLLVQAPLLALLISFVADGAQFEGGSFGITRSLLFALSCSAFWVGIMNSIQEVCKERNILKREYMAGLRLDSYIFSKLVVMAIVCAVQSVLLVTTFAIFVGLPYSGIFLGAYIEFLLATFFISLSASAMGVFVSSLFTNADRAMTVAPLLLMPQLLFSGMIFELSGVTNIISWAVTSRWAMMSYGSTSDLNALGGPTSHFYTNTAGHILSTWGVLVLFIVLYAVFAVVVLRGLNKEEKR